MNNTEKGIMRMELEGYLKEKSEEIVKDLKEAFPGIKDAKVAINIWFGPLENTPKLKV